MVTMVRSERIAERLSSRSEVPPQPMKLRPRLTIQTPIATFSKQRRRLYSMYAGSKVTQISPTRRQVGDCQTSKYSQLQRTLQAPRVRPRHTQIRPLESEAACGCFYLITAADLLYTSKDWSDELPSSWAIVELMFPEFIFCALYEQQFFLMYLLHVLVNEHELLQDLRKHKELSARKCGFKCSHICHGTRIRLPSTAQQASIEK